MTPCLVGQVRRDRGPGVGSVGDVPSHPTSVEWNPVPTETVSEGLEVRDPRDSGCDSVFGGGVVREKFRPVTRTVGPPSRPSPSNGHKVPLEPVEGQQHLGELEVTGRREPVRTFVVRQRKVHVDTGVSETELYAPV